MKTFKQLLEALTPEQKADVDTWKRGKHAWSNHAFGKGETRTHVPLEFPDHKSEHQSKVEDHLREHGIHVHDYIGGFGTDKHGRQVSIGKALVKTKAPHLVTGFASDPVRQQLRAFKDCHVVISKHPHDVAGMTSSGQSWVNQSCMNFSTGSYREYLKKDVEHGTHVAYLVHKDDKDIEKPLARIALKPFNDGNKSTILRPEDRTYGNAPDAFSHTVNRWVNKHFPGKEDGIYKKNIHIYNDTHYNTVVMGDKAFDRAIKHRDTNIAKMALHNPNLTTDQLNAAFKKTDLRDAVINHPNSTQEHLDKGAKSKYGFIRAAVFSSPKATSEHLHLGLKDIMAHNRVVAMNNPNATKEHVDVGINDNDDWRVRQRAIQNPHSTIEHLEKALNDRHEYVRRAALNHPNVTAEHIDKALQDGYISVRYSAIRSKNASKENIDKALRDSETPVREAAVSHPNATEEHIKKGLNDYSVEVREAAVSHPKATVHHLNLALEDRHPVVRRLVFNHPNATKEHIERGLRDEYWNVRRGAVLHPNSTMDHIQKVLNDEDGDVRDAARERLNELKRENK